MDQTDGSAGKRETIYQSLTILDYLNKAMQEGNSQQSSL